ncbi:hypothetical protein [Nitrosococcus watsonii]|uniref:Uncharacterized protein n=1 Tax=Nitrosococcus watsoni (strain C-113) TaxID=105559 RepID=D8K4V0_NITWC|nr:hypothetical protein [Nitrosococcus watsonii]ADJ27927.1 conserved hypothetical protein [Nitrosococcus watsonii C-113]
MALRSLLDLINSQAHEGWRLMEEGQANVVLFDVDTKAGWAAWNTNQGLTQKSIRVWCSRRGPTEAVKYYLKKPYRYRHLADLLAMVGQSQKKAGEVAFPSAAIKSKPRKRLAGPSFEPAKYFLGLLLSAIEEKRSVRFQYQDSAPLYVEPAGWEYFYPDSERALRRLCGSVSSCIQVESITKDLLVQQVAQDGIKSCSLQSLIWLAAFEGSAGRPLPGWREEGLFKLKQWPNLGVLQHDLDEMRLAAFMTKQAATLVSILTHTGVAKRKAVSFINACYAVGLLEKNIEIASISALATANQKQGGSHSPAHRLRSSGEKKPL